MAPNNAYHGAGQSSVGHAAFYEAGDQRNEPQSVINERERYKEGKSSTSYDRSNEAELSKSDPTKPAQLHGNKPSRGAEIDRELQMEDEQRLREKGVMK
ncbi:hypothetical protein N7510_004212 [Penicillium lagena]|uniref:uncharacterized protein n=1 Tax=Penicillium lagena TaxID=94218 RepID=UPI0025414A24|nr:uncharacterized protein N7510_004212 [Penicillium lagena]KAJ5620228.1 hypothetical protein N7510_004212 [Penicillium lagena]